MYFEFLIFSDLNDEFLILKFRNFEILRFLTNPKISKSQNQKSYFNISPF